VSSNLQFLRWIYSLFLTLYPHSYRDEFGSELQIVFDLSLDESAALGEWEVEKLILREAVSLPGAILHEHLRERRKAKMKQTFASRFDFAPGTRSETWAALAPFLFFGALQTLLGYFYVADFVPMWLVNLYGILFWSLGLGLFVLGFLKRFPRWFMPYLGAPMPFISLLLFNIVIEKLQGVWWYKLPFLLSAFMQEGLLWMGLIFMLVLLLLVARLVPIFRPFNQRLREDWTLISFLVYGGAPLALVFTFGDYKNEEPFMFLALLILAAGGWFYLRNEEHLKRFYCLQGGLWFSMLVVAVGKALLAKSSFPGMLDNGWQIEFMSTIITGMWLAMIMTIPLALQTLARPQKASPALQN
jgi:hypothetical protein